MTSSRLTRLAGSLFLALAMLALPGHSFAQGFAISITLAPPPLPVYTQPICPSDGYLWTPGYWAWNDADADYYWVPGTWVTAPEAGLLWTPGYWGWGDGAYVWNAGYWGPEVGFYGGVDYGFGYAGTGFEGGYWQGGQFFYNTSVMRVNTTIIHNVYRKTVINNTHVTRVSYNGGRGGITTRPTAQQEKYQHEHHVERTALQVQHQQDASKDRNLRASFNHGKPPVAATAKPGDFKTGVVAARAGSLGGYHPAAKTAANREKSGRENADARRMENENKAAAERHETTAKTERESKPARTNARTEHANTRPMEAKPTPERREKTAKAESRPPKAEKSERANTRSTEAKPTLERPEKAARESKPPKAQKAERANTRPTEAKPAPERREPAAQAESRPEPKPARSERADAQPAEARPAPARHESAPHASAPRPEHQSSPRENKPEEKKPPR